MTDPELNRPTTPVPRESSADLAARYASELAARTDTFRCVDPDEYYRNVSSVYPEVEYEGEYYSPEPVQSTEHVVHHKNTILPGAG